MPAVADQSVAFDLKLFFLNLMRAISLRPSAVTIEETLHSDILRLSICVDAQDFEMFTESGGRSLLALHTILTAVIRREKLLATIEIVNRQTGAHL